MASQFRHPCPIPIPILILTDTLLRQKKSNASVQRAQEPQDAADQDIDHPVCSKPHRVRSRLNT